MIYDENGNPITEEEGNALTQQAGSALTIPTKTQIPTKGNSPLLKYAYGSNPYKTQIGTTAAILNRSGLAAPFVAYKLGKMTKESDEWESENQANVQRALTEQDAETKGWEVLKAGLQLFTHDKPEAATGLLNAAANSSMFNGSPKVKQMLENTAKIQVTISPDKQFMTIGKGENAVTVHKASYNQDVDNGMDWREALKKNAVNQGGNVPVSLQEFEMATGNKPEMRGTPEYQKAYMNFLNSKKTSTTIVRDKDPLDIELKEELLQGRKFKNDIEAYGLENPNGVDLNLMTGLKYVKPEFVDDFKRFSAKRKNPQVDTNNIKQTYIADNRILSPNYQKKDNNQIVDDVLKAYKEGGAKPNTAPNAQQPVPAPSPAPKTTVPSPSSKATTPSGTWVTNGKLGQGMFLKGDDGVIYKDGKGIARWR